MVWNIKSQQQRLVSLTPSDDWGGAGLLGVTIRLDNYAGAEERLIRVLTVEPKSPAAIAGLVPLKDYLLGTSHQTFDSTQTLGALLQQHEDRVMELYVYNCDADMVRVVALLPTLSWGGRGLLGAEVGQGYLHRLPKTVLNTVGSSVERKVRQVSVNGPSKNRSSSVNGGRHPTEATEVVESDEGNPSTNGRGRNDGSGSNHISNEQTVLELEPQLEMEPHESEEEEDEVDRSAAELSSVALEDSSTVDDASSSQRQQAFQQQQSQPPIAIGSHTQQPTDRPDKGRQQLSSSQEQRELQESPTLSPDQHRRRSSADEVFATGPPSPEQEQQFQQDAYHHYDAAAVLTPTAHSAAAASFLPPPPKMHYDTPTS